MIRIVDGDLFDNDAPIRINTVNCVGVWGKGVALEFKKRYPLAFCDHKKACANGQVSIGKLHVWDGPDGTIINFPTKTHWSQDSKYEYVSAGLNELRGYLKTDARKVAIPALGCTNGRLEWEKVKGMVLESLSDLPNEILLYRPLELQEKTMSDERPRLWMIDDTDLYMATNRLNDIKNGQLKDWEWSRFCDDDYSCVEEAVETYLSDIHGISMFYPGKVIVFYGQPSFQAKMAANLDQIASNVLVVVFGKIDKTTTLYLRAEKYKHAKIEERLAFKPFDDNKEAVEWTGQRAKLLGLNIDKSGCRVVADACSYKPNLIHAELYKLKHASHDGEVTRPLIEMVASNIGNANIMLLCDAIMDDDGESAHMYMQRLISYREDGVKMCGFFMDWARKLAIARACRGNIGPYEDVLKGMRKPEKQDNGSIKKVPMFDSLKGLARTCNNLNKSNKSENFPYDLVASVGRLQIALRGGDDHWDYDDQTLLLHRFVASLVTVN
jgi:O-acetyl-ADP-ribose deacetylase (regulator of RNase III)